MGRNIERLHNRAPATEADLSASALQYLRKVRGMPSRSAANAEAFERAVAEITRELLLEELQTTATTWDREVEPQRARERGRKRDAAMRQRLAAE